MEHDKLWYLKNFNLFENLDPEEMESLSDMITDGTIKKKQPIYMEGDPSETLYFLKKGRVKIVRTDESGKEITLTLLEPGEIFGEMGIFDNAPRETTAVALEDSLLCTMRRRDFEKVMANKPEMSFKLSKLMGLRMRHIENKIQELMFHDVPTRLARLLLRLLEQHPREMRNGVRINIKLSQQEIANLIGATREMTSSTLNHFRKQGLIDIEAKYIYVLDKKGLRAQAKLS